MVAMSTVPGVVVVAGGYSSFAPPVSYIIMVLGIALAVCFPLIVTGKIRLTAPEEVIPALGMTQREWNDVVSHRRSMIPQFVTRYRDATNFEIRGSHLDSLANTTNTADLWAQMEIALNDANDRPTRIAAANQVGQMAEAYKI